jgi:plasmid stability protein
MKAIVQQEEAVGLQPVLENVADVLTDSLYPESVRINKALALISAADVAVPSMAVQRYRKLRAELEFSPFHMGLIRRRGEFHFIEGRFDAAVDALPDPNGKKPSRRTR